jgi:hypothetical protein
MRFKWPQHGYMPSTAPFQLYPLLTSAEEARNIVAHMDDNERSLLSEELRKFEERKSCPTDASSVHQQQQPVTTEQLVAAFTYNGLPFVGFGILDNGIMIIAGEYIDVTIGATLGISTMAAAALGNLVSDVAGVGCTGYIESFVSKFGVSVPHITHEQSQQRRVRWTVAFGRTIGITVGCLIGMLPLLLYDTKESDAAQSTSLAADSRSTSRAMIDSMEK